MIDETNRATAGVTEAPEGEPGEASASPGQEPQQPTAERLTDETPAAAGELASADTPAADDETPPSAEDGGEAGAGDADAPGEAEAQPETDAAAAGSDASAAPAAPTPSEEPMTMAELLDSPHNEVKSLKHGDVVEGTVVRIDPDEILVDFGGKSEGVVSNRELMGRRGPRDGDEARPELSVGDEVLVYVLQPESPEGHAVLSLRRAGLERKWRAMQERFEAGEIVEARVIDHNKGGLIVDLGVRGFVPISQIVDFPRRPRDEQPRDAAQEIAEKLQPFVGRTLRLKILEVNRKANRLILSEKVALYEERREKRDELFSSLQVGQRVTGVVRSIAPFGVFVDLGGIDGLVHKSELSWNKVNNPESAYQIGEEVEAEVIDINHERGRISLSIRRLQADPWQESVAKYKIGDVIEGTVTKLVNFGAFVRVEEGLEGLIHISELSNQRVAHPGDVVQEGQQVKLRIISLDSDRHRLGLSLKQAEDRPAPTGEDERDRDRGPERTGDRERPRRDRMSGGGRRDRVEYRPEDATAEPEGGIESSMAAAFASSGLLDQFRASQEADDATAAEVDTPPTAQAEAPDEAAPATATVDGPAPDATAVDDDLRGSEETGAGDEKKKAPARASRASKSKPVADEADAEGQTDGAGDVSEPAASGDANEGEPTG